MTRALPPLPLDRDETIRRVTWAHSEAHIAACAIERSEEHEDFELPEAAETLRRLRKAAKQLQRALGALRAIPGRRR